jgi:DNA modification methylase
VVVVELGDADARILAQALNRTRGTDDPEAYARLLDDVLGLVGVERVTSLLPESESSIDRALASIRPPTEEGEVPAVPSDPVSRPGEVYELGAHRLICGDATDPECLAGLLQGERAALLFTDPPYGVNYQGDDDPESLRRRHRRTDGRATVANDALGDEGTRHLVAGMLRTVRAVADPGASFYLCAPSGISELWFRLAVADAGIELRQVLAWVKDQFAFGRQDYHWRHESILYGWFPGAAHHWFGGRDQDTVWEIPRPKQSLEHPTMKPVELILRALRNSSSVGDVVLDPFGGSGSTLIACESSNRRAFMVELDPGYCDVIRTRYERLQLGIAVA